MYGVVCVPADAARRQQLMSASILSAPLARPVKPVASASSKGTVDDDDDFNHDELNRYLNEELIDDDDNDEPKVSNDSTDPPPTIITTNTTKPVTQRSATPTLDFEEDTTLITPISTPAPTTTNDTTNQNHDDEKTQPAAAEIGTPDLSTSVDTLPGDAPETEPSTRVETPATASIAPIAVPKVIDSVSAPSPSNPPVINSSSIAVVPPVPTPSVVPPPSGAPAPAPAPSPLDNTDEDDLAELESMLEDVAVAGGDQLNEEEFDEQQLAELENELDGEF